jgi:4-hydroxy-tetrahydrodipicolinate synthase
MMSYGGLGVISVAANIVPRTMHDMVAHYLAGDTAGSARLQIELVPLIKALSATSIPCRSKPR